ncbi:uncharacterized protein [Mytilus edulis]
MSDYEEDDTGEVEEDDISQDNGEAEEEEEITFQIIVGGSLRGKCLLKDSKGYNYTLKAEKGEKSWWRCSKRTNYFRCGASVSQVGNKFTIGRYPHEHPPDPKINPCDRTKKRRSFKKELEREVEKALGDASLMTCSSVDSDNTDDSPLKIKISPVKKFKSNPNTNNNSERDIQDELLKLEKERLQVDKDRLRVERERLEVSKQILEEIRNHSGRCNCMNPAVTSMVI